MKIFFGHETGSEWFIQDLEKRIFFYDFTIPDLKLIIEFHGENFHPNKEKLSENEWAAWRMPFRNYTADQAYASDREKEALAKSKGFDYVIVWNDGNIQETVERLHDIILKKIRLRANEEIEQF